MAGAQERIYQDNLQAKLEGEVTSKRQNAATSKISPEFRPSKELAGRVEFWKLVLGKYDKTQAVIHHRLYPQIIYSVLDFSDLQAKPAAKVYAKLRERAVEKEKDRVRLALLALAQGKAPSDELEKRIVQLFREIPGNKSRLYKTSAAGEMVRSQTGIRDQFEAGLRRSGRYLYAIERIFRERGLPWEISRLPLVESSFNYEAYSSVGAAGIWQFMRSTGKRFLNITSNIDERRDPIRASHAAARYLSLAYEDLEAWPLAITSYNHGVSGVLKAIRETGSRKIERIIDEYENPTFGFASSNFFASFLAALDLEQNSEQYFPGLRRDEPWYFDEYQVARSMKISEVERLTGVTRGDLERSNPNFLKPVWQGRANVPAGYTVRIPPKTAKISDKS